jgi:hypothetical protein
MGGGHGRTWAHGRRSWGLAGEEEREKGRGRRQGHGDREEVGREGRHGGLLGAPWEAAPLCSVPAACWTWGRRSRRGRRKRKERKTEREKEKERKMEKLLNLEILRRKIKNNLWTWYKNKRQFLESV